MTIITGEKKIIKQREVDLSLNKIKTRMDAQITNYKEPVLVLELDHKFVNLFVVNMQSIYFIFMVTPTK